MYSLLVGSLYSRFYSLLFLGDNAIAFTFDRLETLKVARWRLDHKGDLRYGQFQPDHGASLFHQRCFFPQFGGVTRAIHRVFWEKGYTLSFVPVFSKSSNCCTPGYSQCAALLVTVGGLPFPAEYSKGAADVNRAFFSHLPCPYDHNRQSQPLPQFKSSSELVRQYLYAQSKSPCAPSEKQLSSPSHSHPRTIPSGHLYQNADGQIMSPVHKQALLVFPFRLTITTSHPLLLKKLKSLSKMIPSPQRVQRLVSRSFCCQRRSNIRLFPAGSRLSSFLPLPVLFKGGRGA